MSNEISADYFRNIRSNCYDALKNRKASSDGLKVQLDMAHEKIERLTQAVLLMLEYLEKQERANLT